MIQKPLINPGPERRWNQLRVNGALEDVLRAIRAFQSEAEMKPVRETINKPSMSPGFAIGGRGDTARLDDLDDTRI